MNRGEIWTVSGGSDYAGKPRPVVIIQDNRFDATASITVCPLTSNQTDAPLIRIPVPPDPGNGLNVPSRLMVDKITTVPKTKMGERIGQLSDEASVQLNRAIIVFLGLASSKSRPASE